MQKEEFYAIRFFPCKIRLNQDLRAFFWSFSPLCVAAIDFPRSPSLMEPHRTALSAQGIQWKFISPAAPHFVGLWEAAAKSVKFRLKRVIGAHPLTYTLVVQIEQVMNSRPLTPLTGCPEDRDALTPGHFLIGSSLLALPEPVDFNESSSHLHHWRLIQSMFQHLWMRWSREYILSNSVRNGNEQRPTWRKAILFCFWTILYFQGAVGHWGECLLCIPEETRSY